MSTSTRTEFLVPRTRQERDQAAMLLPSDGQIWRGQSDGPPCAMVANTELSGLVPFVFPRALRLLLFVSSPHPVVYLYAASPPGALCKVAREPEKICLASPHAATGPALFSPTICAPVLTFVVFLFSLGSPFSV
ncbi:hypothetical protein VTN49DRAFT_159 [Thermomyces lanuginosus]|uniref:uncharacterized protein n=1 Tax=Thermomyces lanuginosus TaxID=5541 RepID=UPI003742052B